MIATPDAAGSDAPGWESPADDVADEEVDVLYLAGQCPSGKGAWLWVTTADARREASSPACSCRAPGRGQGGDVLLHIAPGRGEGDVERGRCCRAGVGGAPGR